MRVLEYIFVILLVTLGCDAIRNSPQPLAKMASIELYVLSAAKTPNSKQATDPVTNAAVFLTTPAIITSADVESVERSEDRQPSLTVNLTPSGAKKLAAATANPLGMQIATVVNGTVVGIAKVHATMSTGFRISGGEISDHRDEMFESLSRN